MYSNLEDKNKFHERAEKFAILNKNLRKTKTVT